MSSSESGMLVPQSVRLQDDLRSAKEELTQTISQIKKLQERKRELDGRISNIKCELDMLSKGGSASAQYEVDTFPWSDEMMSKLRSVFKIEDFRSYQKAAVNATMNNLDCLLIMPTGGGKSLCFQLPAILSKGITLVVSPLISLMEDQLQSMKELGIHTALFNSNTSREETKFIFDSMINPSATLKLLYVTPEKLAKSKRLMSQLEKAYRANRFARLVIDEVHCCSQWGHDFRPDYKFLGIMKTQYPKTPIIGLTATATPNVIIDVQKILNIEGSLVFKDTFFRPNLKYEVLDCGEASKIEDIANLINTRFPKQSGIIYCLTIKDCEEVSEKLRTFKIRAARYHAQLEPEKRTEIQKKWYNNEVQVIVATVAFGMGINKLDVRYVIHHSMSKSVENYYQETGRAGRDGNPAHCILFFKFGDSFRASSLMFTEKNGVVNVYNMLKYSLDRSNCRKGLLAQHFGDAWELSGCGEMCDNCDMKSSGSNQYQEINAGPLLDDIDSILDHASHLEERMTALKLMDAWLGKGNKKLRVETVATPKFNRQTCETIVALLLIDGFLKEEFHFTPYSTISYIVAGAKVVLRSNGKISQDIQYQIPLSIVNPSKAKTSKKPTTSSSSVKEKDTNSKHSSSSSPKKSTPRVHKESVSSGSGRGKSSSSKSSDHRKGDDLKRKEREKSVTKDGDDEDPVSKKSKFSFKKKTSMNDSNFEDGVDCVQVIGKRFVIAQDFID
ncbi:unnamed protein product [Allacma fusca]|uniref:ATP-dependent DNA helicase n=1 Tax=Allacma fusca TaxID=39272 RepID=A0A8J2KXL4_9HEXA|nr:unnamed protein product [Allacma fusca]